MRKLVGKPIYHGTTTEITAIDVTKGRGHKDFGKGFYLAFTKTQSVGIARRKERQEKSRDNTGKAIRKIIYTFNLNYTILESLNVKYFEYADMEWLEFILACRNVNGTQHNYDIVIGPTADDSTVLCLNNYREGVYGDINSIQAKRTLLYNLEVENLGIQVFIGTQRGSEALQFIRKEYV